MKIHFEGYKIILISVIIFCIINWVVFSVVSKKYLDLQWVILGVTFVIVLWVVSFFRVYNRSLTINDKQIISPADGKIVVVEEVFDNELLHTKCKQVSIFMSPFNVHVNLIPFSGEVVFERYYEGTYLFAWHEKSSMHNERMLIAIKHKEGTVLCKQIAGGFARRICTYTKVGKEVKQGEELGFIKFGSRVDLLLPLHAKVLVSLNQKVKGGVTPIAQWHNV